MTNATAYLMAIPAGYFDGKPLLMVQVMPCRDGKADGLPLECWPELVARIGALRVRIEDAAGNVRAPEEAIPLLGRFLSDPHAGLGYPRYRAATELWQRLFQPQGFAALRSVLGSIASEPRRMAAVEAASIRYTTSRTAELSLWLRAMVKTLHSGRSGDQDEITRLIHRVFAPDDQASKRVAGYSPTRVADELQHQLAFSDRWATQLGRDDSAKALDEAVAFLRQLVREHEHSLSPPDSRSPVSDEASRAAELTAEDHARRKLSGLLALPSLAHYLGLGVMITLDTTKAALPQMGRLKVEWLDQTSQPIASQASPWTAFDTDNHLHFGPREASNSVWALRKGLVELGKSRDGYRRFFIDVIDVVNTLNDLRVWRTQGGLSTPLSPTSVRRRGIALHDREKIRVMAQESLAAQEFASTEDPSDHVLFADDLIVGVRADVGVKKEASESRTSSIHWRSTSTRQIRCLDPDGVGSSGLIDPALYDHPVMRHVVHHDHGMGFAVVKERSANPAVDGEDELVTWAGESLALSASAGEVSVDPVEDLGLAISYEPITSTSMLERQPALREGLTYCMAARAVFALGVSRRIEDVRGDLDADDRWIGVMADGMPLEYPPAALVAPELTLPPDEPYVLATPADVARFKGDAVDRLLVRDSGSEARQPTRRLLLPARASFDEVEQAGGFDHLDVDRPMGAFAGPLFLRLPTHPDPQDGMEDTEGALPEARIGEVWQVMERSGGLEWINLETGGGAPDPLPEQSQSRGAVSVFTRRERRPNGRYFVNPQSRCARLVLTGEGASAGGPAGDLLVEFWPDGADPAAARPVVLELVRGRNPGANLEWMDPGVYAVDGVRLPCVRVTMGPAEEYSLSLHPGTTLDVTPRKVTLKHAVTAPLVAPGVINSDEGVYAVTITACEATRENDSESLLAWGDYVNHYNATPMQDWPSHEGGSTTFFIGNLGFDRKSTGAVQAEASWEDWGPQTFVRNATGTWSKSLPVVRDNLFCFDVEPSGHAEKLNLVRSDPTNLRGLSYAFKDGRTRKLAIKLVAESRYKEDMPQVKSKASGLIECITRCTFRPSIPKVDVKDPWFDLKHENQRSTREANRFRIELEEGWFETGYGEQLALVLRRPDTDLAAVGDFVSRISTDPVHPGAVLPMYLTEHDVRGGLFVKDVPLYLNDASATQIREAIQSRALISSKPAARVDLVALDVQQEDAGPLFVEFELKSTQAYGPFAQLGLVRYQPNAVQGLEASFPIRQQLRMLPRRELTFTFPTFRTVRLKLRGPGFTPRSSATNHLSVDLVEWNEQSGTWIPSPRGNPSSVANLAPAVDGNEFVYESTLNIPSLTETRSLGVMVKEFEVRPKDGDRALHPCGYYTFTDAKQDRVVYTLLRRIRYSPPNRDMDENFPETEVWETSPEKDD